MNEHFLSLAQVPTGTMHCTRADICKKMPSPVQKIMFLEEWRILPQVEEMLQTLLLSWMHGF